MLTTTMSATTNKGEATMDNLNNLIDWRLELTLQERLSRREAVASFVDEAGLTLALALLPWIVLIQIMF